MMQQPNSFSRFSGLPKLGEALSEMRSWESTFRALCSEANFTEVNLPMIAPLLCFKSLISGETTLPPGPRFTDAHGVEWAMRSDMTAFTTQFILEHASEISFPVRLAYSGKVFRYGSGSDYRASHSMNGGVNASLETYEFGAEIVGMPEISADLEILSLALKSAHLFGYRNLVLVLGDSRISQALFQWLESNQSLENRAYKIDTLKKSMAAMDLSSLADWLENSDIKAEFNRVLETSLAKVFLKQASDAHSEVHFTFDPWATRAQNFYSGLTFEIFADAGSGKNCWVGGGGRYNSLYSNFGRNLPAVGFMLRPPSNRSLAKKRPIRIALPKGRLIKKALEIFATVGIEPEVDPNTTRKLVLLSKCKNYEFLLVKNSDITSYLNENVADLALCGSDILDEHPAHVFRPATFAFGQCRLCLAGKPEFKKVFTSLKRARVASKYVNIAREALRVRGISCEIFPLQGSVELASVIQFSDAIVDLVETGDTLRENGLVVFEELGSTRVQLAVTRGFFYQYHSLWRNWVGAWIKSGVVKPDCEQTLSHTNG